MEYVHCGPFYLGQPIWVTGMPDYKGNLFGMNRYSVKFIQSQRDIIKGEMLEKSICSKRLYHSAPIRTKEYDEGKILVHSRRTRGTEGKAGTLALAAKF